MPALARAAPPPRPGPSRRLREIIAEVARLEWHSRSRGSVAFVVPVNSAASSLPRLRCVCGENWRIDSISSPKNSSAVRGVGIGRENVEDAAATTELAGHFDGLRVPIAVFDQPGRQLFQVDGLSRLQPAAQGSEAGAIGNRLDQRLQRRQDQTRRVLAFQLFEQTQTLAGDFIDADVGRSLGMIAEIVPGGEKDGIEAGEAGRGRRSSRRGRADARGRPGVSRCVLRPRTAAARAAEEPQRRPPWRCVPRAGRTGRRGNPSSCASSSGRSRSVSGIVDNALRHGILPPCFIIIAAGVSFSASACIAGAAYHAPAVHFAPLSLIVLS